MQRRIIDCCSLINLATGWRGLDELAALDCQWHVCDAVLKESEFTREYDGDAVPVLVPLDVRQWMDGGLLLHVRPESEQELEDYLEFAYEVDDGEAQALSIAKHRGFTLLTDDRKAIKLVQREDVGVQTVSTAGILQAWAALAPANKNRLPAILSRIEVLARFRPPAGSQDSEWWDQNSD